MLHKIEPLKCGEKFARILALQQQVVAFACNTSTGLPLTSEAILAEFGEAGEWLWKQLWIQSGKNQGDKSPFHLALERLIAHLKAGPAKRDDVLNTYRHDVGFNEHLTEDQFRFEYDEILDEATREVVGPVMIAFYEDLLYDGFPEDVHQDPGRFDRDAVVGAFWQSNADLNVCPACDAQRPDSIGTKNYSDLDHYFPKARYPFLAVHPGNLVPVCKGCNSSFKGVRDPIDDATNAPLLNVFLPYHCSAVEFAEIRTTRLSSGPLHFALEDGNGIPSRRVSNLNRVFRLEERWPGRQKQVIESIVEELQGARRTMERFGGVPDDTNLQIELDDMLKRKRERIGKDYNYLLHTSYLEFAAGNDGEFLELLAQFRGE